MLCRVPLIVLVLVGLACASPQPVAPIDAGAMRPGANESVNVDLLVIIADTSSSITESGEFPRQRALIRSFVDSLPDGNYEAGAVVFGGFERQTYPLAPFDRGRFASGTDDIAVLNEGTPLDRVFAETSTWLEGKSGRAAVVVFTDGLPTDAIGRPSDGAPALDAARALAETHKGGVCFHSVQLGNSSEGAEFLRRLSAITGCGTFRAADAVYDVATLHGLQRDVFLGGGLPAVAAAPHDADGDGVYDLNDRCPATPRGAQVDRRGCWGLPAVTFRLDSAKIDSRFRSELDGVVSVLQNNPNLRVRIDGHTDTTGAERHNEKLSQRRARAVGDFLIAAGVDASRIETQGWGQRKPAYPNDTEAQRSANRRAEISIVR
jgi:OOP family OmpA-OmpF porin